MRIYIWALAIFTAVIISCDNKAKHDAGQTDVQEPPRWHWQRVEHGLGDLTLTSVWVRSDGAVFTVGWAGTILYYNPDPDNDPLTEDSIWKIMPSGTTEILSAIAGIENGADFGLPNPQGEMIAVGWSGTVLHYNPNPDNDPLTEDGAWKVIAGPGVAQFVSRKKVDPFCPDYDGDGIADDGDGDGYWGNALCVSGNTVSCDDNCREVANGTLRPFEDFIPTGQQTGDGCIGPQDSPDPTKAQLDTDGDGIGTKCEDDDNTYNPAAGFSNNLYAVDIIKTDTGLDIVAVGENGAVVSYHGPSAADIASLSPGIADVNAWLAQDGVAYRNSDDCPSGTPAGTTCENGRTPPECPAMCNPQRTACPCPSGSGQCCNDTASTGVGCGDASCPPATNACISGDCNFLCPECFRRLIQSLRGVAIDGDDIVAVGLSGTIIVGSITDPGEVWTAPSCSTMPAPLDKSPVLSAVGANGGSFLAVGNNGALVRYPGGSSCNLAPIAGGPPVFLLGLYATSDSNAYIVGDGGLLFRLNGGVIQELTPNVDEGLYAVGNTYYEGFERIWAVGASGVIVTGAYY
ncbi:MAG: hypothetical protein JW841_00390 [Deltaproteobacteria bacterium]|nr:hypothetical protein [Deltaproteobacteria bacterium]